MSDSPRPGLQHSSTLRSAVLAALAVWAPGAVLVCLQHRDWSRHTLEQAADELEELGEELLTVTREHGVGSREGALGEPLEDLEEVDDETPNEFLARYIGRIYEEQHRGGEPSRRPSGAPGSHRSSGTLNSLELRLAILGEGDPDGLALAPLEALSELMEEEVPEAFHETLEELFERHYETQEEALEAAEVSTEALVTALEDLELVEESDACVQVEDAAGRIAFSSFGDTLSTVEVGRRFTLTQITGPADARRPDSFDDSSEELEPWCLTERLSLVDGGRLLFGTRIDERYRLLRRSAIQRNLLLALGLPLAIAVGWLQSRPISRFLAALGAAARRQEQGEVGARLQISPDGRDLALAVATVNRMLARLEQTVQGLSRVSDSIAHDLRTPLSRLQGQLDLLKRSADPSGELIEAVQEEADQLLQTFNALLRIAQVETGVRKQGFRSLDFVEIVHDVADLYAPVFAEKGIAFTTGVPRGRIDYQGDRDLWLQALSNLTENALKYTPAGGNVRLELDDRGKRPLIRLVDSGPGIPERERENVFRRFYRLQRHRGERGTGLGLSLVGAVCDLHRAEIRLGGDRGLTVEIEL